MSVASAPSLNPNWPAMLGQLSRVLDLDASARAAGALVRRRNIGDAATHLRLALADGPGGLSLRSAAAWAGISGVAHLSDVALRRLIRGASEWLGQVAGALLVVRPHSLLHIVACSHPHTLMLVVGSLARSVATQE